MRGTVSLSTVILWNKKNRSKSEEKKKASRPFRVQDLAHAGDGQLAEAADLVEFLVVDGDPNA